MFFIGDNNGQEVSNEVVDAYINKLHRSDSIFGLAKGNYFWAKDIKFESEGIAKEYIKNYESRGFKVYHNISIADTKLVANEEIESEVIDKEVKLIEEVKRKGANRSRRKE
ncbi:MAG TPA: hypothetical protein DCG38_02115 [Eubacteriaceae bacterium]|nr:hypothetical protein [Eubacteriaceae bacterium]